ncbi:MAG: TRAP transporter substrate-binding protein DctP [Rhodobacteraceae bacterium]|nr:TRAP transporter substrate-binding protein DctP [Paracoccaceae bacterium]
MKRYLAGLAVAALSTGAAQAETLQYASAFPEADVFTQLVILWGNQVSEATGGALDFDVVPSGALVPLPEALDAISFGVVPSGMVVASFISGTIPAMGYMEMLGGLPVENPSTGEAMAQVWGDVDALFAEHGIKGLWGAPAFASGVICREGHLHTRADWEGLKIRTAGRWQAQQVAAMGAVPVPLPPSELYVALQNGVVDCALMTPTIVMSARLYEVAPYYTNTDLAGNATITVMNLDTWNGLSDDERTAVQTASDAMMQTAATAMRQSAEDGLQALSGLGQVYTLNAEEAAELMQYTSPVFDQVAAGVTEGPGVALIQALASFRH